MFNLFGDAGRFLGSPEPVAVYGNFVAPNYLYGYNGSQLLEGPKFHFNNSTHGGNGAALDPAIDLLMQTLHPTNASLRRYNPEFSTVRLEAGQGTANGETHNNEPHYLCMLNQSRVLTSVQTMNYWVYLESGSALITATTGNLLSVNGEATSTPIKVTNGDGWTPVTRLIDFDSNAFYGYSNQLFRLYAAPDSVLLLALPFMYPGRLKVDAGTQFGLVNSLAAWR